MTDRNEPGEPIPDSRPMPTELWSRLDRSRPAIEGPARPRRSLRAGLAIALAPPLLALVGLSLVAVLSYERASGEVERARAAVSRAETTADRATRQAAVDVAEDHLDGALDEARRAQQAIAVGLLGALALAVVAAMRLNRRVVRPVRTAERAARRVNAGEVGVRLDPSAAGEIGELAAAVNALADDLDRIRPQLATTAMIERSPDLVLVVGQRAGDDGEPRLVVLYASPVATDMLGRPSEWLTGVPVASFVHPDDRDELLAIVDQPSRADGAAAAPEIRFSHVQGRWIATEVVAADLRVDPNVQGVALYVRDLFERKAEEEELRHLALHDPLTRLANRTLFSEHVQHALARILRVQSRPHAVLLFDLDGFKTINDSLGHAAGDEVLVELAERLRTRVRPGDTAARLGGDEFGVLLENSSETDAEVVAQRIMDALSGPIEVHGKEVVITGSVGIALSEAGHDAEALMRNADVAMYSAKASGKGQYRMFQAEMQEAVARRLDLEADLRRAIEQGELVLHYQPIVDLATGAVANLEVLVRWRRADRDLVYPGDFIAVAEESGLIRPMGRWILSEACRQEQVWSRQRRPGMPPAISVNVSPVQVDDPGFDDDLVASLEESGTEPGRLTLEITESLFMRNFESAVETLQRVKELGVKVAIDDFGTGWSSFSRLKSMPIDILKIDKAFVDGVTRGPEESAVAQAIVRMASSFGLRTVAEGIEYPSQAEVLSNMKCDMGQGYYFAPPLPPDALEAFLRRRRTPTRG